MQVANFQLPRENRCNTSLVTRLLEEQLAKEYLRTQDIFLCESLKKHLQLGDEGEGPLYTFKR